MTVEHEEVMVWPDDPMTVHKAELTAGCLGPTLLPKNLCNFANEQENCWVGEYRLSETRIYE